MDLLYIGDDENKILLAKVTYLLSIVKTIMYGEIT